MGNNQKAAVFIMLGQSNAVGHGIPMQEKDKINIPLKNVFGLYRKENQSFDNKRLVWSGYTSFGMNLAEEQDHTYSVPNCLATLWQNHIDGGNVLNLPNLYIVHIAIGAQGVTEGFMWHPDRKVRLIPGKLGTVDISLFPFCKHIFSLLEESFREMDVDYEIIGLHWRGGENDVDADEAHLTEKLQYIYQRIFDEFNTLLKCPPIVLHKLVCAERMNDLDPTGKKLAKMHDINDAFKRMEEQYENISILNPQFAPQFVPGIRGNGIFISDAVHFTQEVNEWVAQRIFEQYNYKYRGE